MLHAILARAGRSSPRRRGPPGARVEPWDYRYVVGEAERRLRSAIPLDRLRPINDTHLRSLGADPDALAIGYDVVPRRGRPGHPGRLHGTGGRPGPWVFATYTERGGLGNLAELLHESGHALHYAAIRTSPAFTEPPADFAAFFEAVAELWAGTSTSPRSRPSISACRSSRGTTPLLERYGGVLLDVCWALFEIELYRAPGGVRNDVWAEIVADGLGIEPHPEWSWWAVRGQLIDSPGYLANYVLAAIAAAALRHRIREIRGDWSSGDPGWYAFVSERLLRYGGARSPADLIAELLGGPLTEQPFSTTSRRPGCRADPQTGISTSASTATARNSSDR